ncbi:MAG: hypothetical protein IPM24_20000 [Bryobacterales bacterium]|nr:hypothetical protein [Bryobacterales bacterium]
MWPPVRLAVLGLLPLLGAAQVPNVAGVGYCAPTVTVAPGQIVSVFVRTATHLSEPVTASQFPLPTTLAGFTVVLHQTFAGPVNVPLLAVYTAEACPLKDRRTAGH